MALPLSWITQAIADNTRKSSGDPETTSFSVPVTTLTPANVAAQETLMGNLATAIAGITLGNTVQRELVYWRQTFEKVPASSPLAQRENKWLVRYHDATTFQRYQVSIGTADLSKLATNSEFLDLGSGDGAAFKTAFEAVVVSPADASHAVIVDSVQFVGRNT